MTKTACFQAHDCILGNKTQNKVLAFSTVYFKLDGQAVWTHTSGVARQSIQQF